MPQPLRVHLAPAAPPSLADPRALGLEPEQPWPAGERRVLVPRLGWVLVRVHAGAALGEVLRARLGAPRSLSMAEREWNLVCRLREHGVGTPDPLAVGARGGVLFASESFLVLDEPRGYVRLDEWVRMQHAPAARRLGLSALARFAARLFGSGVVLPRLAPEDILLSAPEALGVGPRIDPGSRAAGDCDGPRPRGLRTRALPGVMVTSFAGGRERSSAAGADERRAILERFERDLADLALTRRERLAFAARGFDRQRRARARPVGA